MANVIFLSYPAVSYDFPWNGLILTTGEDPSLCLHVCTTFTFVTLNTAIPFMRITNITRNKSELFNMFTCSSQLNSTKIFTRLFFHWSYHGLLPLVCSFANLSALCHTKLMKNFLICWTSIVYVAVAVLSEESSIEVLSNLPQWFFLQTTFSRPLSTIPFCNTRESTVCILWKP